MKPTKTSIARTAIARTSNSTTAMLLLRAALAAVLVTAVAGTSMAQLETAAALSGLDPVALTQGKELQGKKEIFVDHKGYRYLFASQKNRKRFGKTPERYRIQNQFCPVEPTAPGRPDLFAVHDQKIYIFATPACIEQFEAAPESYLDGQ